MTDVYIGVGSNIKPEYNIIKALRHIMKKTAVKATSIFYYTTPLEYKNQPDYCNGVWKITTSIKPYNLKYKILRQIEIKLGRIRNTDKYSSRPIDLDIIIYGNAVINTEDLIIPDPDVYSRPFVCLPLFEITEDIILPDTGKALKEIVLTMDATKMRPAHQITNQIKKGIGYE